MATGKVKPNPVRLRPNGIAGVKEGLEFMAAGKVSPTEVASIAHIDVVYCPTGQRTEDNVSYFGYACALSVKKTNCALEILSLLYFVIGTCWFNDELEVCKLKLRTQKTLVCVPFRHEAKIGHLC